MKKLRIFEHISLDGVIQHSADENDFPYSDWTAPYRTPAGRDVVLAMYGEKFDLLREIRSLRVCIAGDHYGYAPDYRLDVNLRKTAMRNPDR